MSIVYYANLSLSHPISLPSSPSDSPTYYYCFMNFHGTNTLEPLSVYCIQKVTLKPLTFKIHIFFFYIHSPGRDKKSDTNYKHSNFTSIVYIKSLENPFAFMELLALHNNNNSFLCLSTVVGMIMTSLWRYLLHALLKPVPPTFYMSMNLKRFVFIFTAWWPVTDIKNYSLSNSI